MKKCERLDETLIKQMMEILPGNNTIIRMADIFQALQSETRLKLLFLLTNKDMCVCELTYALDVTQSAISHSLRTLRQLDLVRVKKEGRYTVYYIADEHVRLLIEMCKQHVIEEGK
ncbi:metalloregulator ArsR/SmtB family transcription factor [Methanohalophilus sp.]|uniref:ArsR/SmtB family transcription factor n=1 Tax=Methanohalophilus sp. TaxID=1966352 RepID=UPI002609D190|nr:metalloregulator ArsR/SmtB family transcription factor [Methanohalophilus sp.]MDK2892098.1 ArsR family transcriptional regulator, lead/cadmium/zinc/bismuth-responsive transcriptional [Methanohalophilus sp.]